MPGCRRRCVRDRLHGTGWSRHDGRPVGARQAGL